MNRRARSGIQTVHPRRRAAGLLHVLVGGLLLWGILSRPAVAQDLERSRIGIAHIGAIGVYGGAVSLEHDADGVEGGVTLDLGWLRAPRFRLQAEVSLLRATLTEFVEVDDATFDGEFFDLTTSIGIVALMRNASARAAPYVAAGVAVHALSSTFGSVTLDRRYNANPFGAYVAAGARLWLSGTGRNALSLEVRMSSAEHVSRSSARLGGLLFFGDMVRPRGR